ncbi:MAG: hypothetical protein ABIR79_11370, partial [Candidatus Binatia bacterium]
MRNRCLMMMSLLSVLAALPTTSVDAGCGCAKPPPPASLVRPAFASPGDVVTFFPPDNRSGEYEVRISESYKTKRNAVWKRDLSDGQYKWQVVVTAPRLPIGPTAIEVKGPGRDFKIASSDFTIMQAPIVLQQGDGETVAKCYSAAVTADHVVLVPLDITAITDHM